MSHVQRFHTAIDALSNKESVWQTITSWLIRENGWVKVGIVTLAILLPFLAFYNLDVNPRPWHDEGSTLSLAHTLAEDGVYAIQNTDGYQAFGAVQSVGPTVVVPVALFYRWFGIGLLQGRIIAGIYLAFAVVLFFLVGRRLFGTRVGLIATFFLLASPGVRLLMYGRQVLGEVPALAFFLAGWLALDSGIASRKHALAALSGLLFGLAIITKSQYLVSITGAFGVLFLMDCFYCRQKTYPLIILAAGIALGCEAGWLAWQRIYYGPVVFADNMAKLAELASVTTGFHLSTALGGVRALLGTDTNHFYFYWGLPALIYIAISCAHKDARSQTKAFLLFFSLIWLAYFILWTIPWPRYLMPTMVISLLFIGKLFDDLAVALDHSSYLLKGKLKSMVRGRVKIPSYAVLSLGTLVALLTFGLWMSYNFQNVVRADVIDRSGEDPMDLYKVKQLWTPSILVDFMNSNIQSGAVVETWERELHTLTSHTYHFPDQSILADVDAVLYRGASRYYRLGEDYFNEVKPAYLVIGYTARADEIYDMDYVNQNFMLMKSFGSDVWAYTVYQRKTP